MIVRELLNDSILNLNLNPKDPKVLARSVSLFNAIMRRYSGNNIMTAFQNSFDFIPESEKVNLGMYTLKDGYRDAGIFTNTSYLPDASSLVHGVDIAYIDGKFYTPNEATDGWEEAGTKSELCEFFPDFLCPDISDVVSLSYKEGSLWNSLGKVPFANFYTDRRRLRFSTRPIGENKVEILVKNTVGKTHKVIYTTSMKFHEYSFMELPEIYIPLVNAALTEELGNAFPAVDPTIVNKYTELRQRIENDISSKNTDDRMIIREEPREPFDFFRVDMWG